MLLLGLPYDPGGYMAVAIFGYFGVPVRLVLPGLNIVFTFIVHSFAVLILLKENLSTEG